MRKRDLRGEILSSILHEPQAIKAKLQSLAPCEGRALREELCRVASSLFESFCHLDSATLVSLFEEWRLYHFLKSRIRGSADAQRGRYMQQLALIAHSREHLLIAEPYFESECREVKFFAQLTRLSLDPSLIVDVVEGFSPPLTSFEMHQIIALFAARGIYLPDSLASKRGVGCVALTLAMIRYFAIEDRDNYIVEIVEGDYPRALRIKALLTLYVVRGEVENASAREFLYSTTDSERQHIERFVWRHDAQRQVWRSRGESGYVASEEMEQIESINIELNESLC